MSNPDWYLDPPDEPEADICEDCGQEMEYIYYAGTIIGAYKCNNHICPGKFDGVAKEMAELIVEQKFLIERIESRVSYLNKKIERLEFIRDEG